MVWGLWFLVYKSCYFLHNERGIQTVHGFKDITTTSQLCAFTLLFKVCIRSPINLLFSSSPWLIKQAWSKAGRSRQASVTYLTTRPRPAENTLDFSGGTNNTSSFHVWNIYLEHRPVCGSNNQSTLPPNLQGTFLMPFIYTLGKIHRRIKQAGISNKVLCSIHSV